jgi:hypothetical protein
MECGVTLLTTVPHLGVKDNPESQQHHHADGTYPHLSSIAAFRATQCHRNDFQGQVPIVWQTYTDWIETACDAVCHLLASTLRCCPRTRTGS